MMLILINCLYFIEVSSKSKTQDLSVKETGAHSVDKILKEESPEQRLGVDEPGFSKTKKSTNRKKSEGDQRLGKVRDKVSAKKQASSHSILTLSSDSESSPANHDRKEGIANHEELHELKASSFQEEEQEKEASLTDANEKSPSKKALKGKGLRKQLKLEDTLDTENKTGDGRDVEVAEEETSEKHRELHAGSSRLPLVLSEKVQRCKVEEKALCLSTFSSFSLRMHIALVECEGDSIDLSGDMGSVGRVVISDTPSGNQDMFLDLKGTIYKTTIVPCRTFCVVSFGQSEAKIEAIMNDFVQLSAQSNISEAETMVEGTLDGFSFDSDEEPDKVSKATAYQIDQKDVAEGETIGKAKRKSEKTSGLPRKKGKTTGSKPQPAKKARKKSQVSKKGAGKK
ncbi:LOW QUALITY PROTEIN: hypothetical protein EUGRSUZ_K00479 [Eucalyptus grandis]|uniref:Uncharacterized protein n=1 Tax=Eucalyptus grandis TaxID=71139 RepID=A0ACC3IRD6_EUCGR|nr:LOW QUALITY PROTEIN: hypothetical protein EUGRSUZ_K00479 [Eucalyptus grandis]